MPRDGTRPNAGGPELIYISWATDPDSRAGAWRTESARFSKRDTLYIRADLAITEAEVLERLGAMLRTELDPRVDVPRNGAIRDCARALGVELEAKESGNDN